MGSGACTHYRGCLAATVPARGAFAYAVRHRSAAAAQGWTTEQHGGVEISSPRATQMQATGPGDGNQTGGPPIIRCMNLVAQCAQRCDGLIGVRTSHGRHHDSTPRELPGEGIRPAAVARTSTPTAPRVDSAMAGHHRRRAARSPEQFRVTRTGVVRVLAVPTKNHRAIPLERRVRSRHDRPREGPQNRMMKSGATSHAGTVRPFGPSHVSRAVSCGNGEGQRLWTTADSPRFGRVASGT